MVARESQKPSSESRCSFSQERAKRAGSRFAVVGRGERRATVTTGLSSGVGCSRLYWTGETAVWFPGKLKGRLGVELEFGKELIGRPDVDFLALGLQFLRTLFLGGFLGPFAHDKQRGLFGDVFGYLAAALGDACLLYTSPSPRD